jgi:hypothetical protein
VDVHDFPGDAVGMALPYGVYDMGPTPAGSMSAPIMPESKYSYRGKVQQRGPTSKATPKAITLNPVMVE